MKDPIIEEIKALQRETQKELIALALSQKETDKKFQATAEKLMKELVVLQKETDKKFQTTAEKIEELTESQKKTDKQLKNMSKEVGIMSRKFGSFTEGMAYPSMKKILRNTFHLTNISPNPIAHHDNDTLEWDAWGYSNGTTNRVVVVEVKNHFTTYDLSQIKRNLKKFRIFYSDHKDKELLCIVACVSFREEALKLAEREGLYFAHIHDDLFDLKNSQSFEPKRF